MRSIIAGSACPTHRLSHLLDQILQNLVRSASANVKDAVHILGRLPQEMAKGMELSTFDVTNLYGIIPHSLGFKAIDCWLSNIPLGNSRISKQFILEGLSIILENSNFYFKGKFHRQLKGTGMGTKVVPVYATLCLGFSDKNLYSIIERKYGFSVGQTFNYCYFRFLDDVLVIYDCRVISLESIIATLNELDSNMHFNLETSGSNVNFLHVNM